MSTTMLRPLVLVVLTHAAVGYGAELQVREEFNTTGALVLLGDIATIHARHSVEAAELATIDLFPAPAAGEQRILKLRELQDLLAVRGVNMKEHRFSGASEILVRGPKMEDVAEPKSRPDKKPSRPRPANTQMVSESVRAAIETHLIEVASEGPWEIEATITADQAAEIAELGDQLIVTGGKEPWTGKQRFHISCDDPDSAGVAVAAEINLPPAIVVARYSLPKGVTLRADDVTLQRGLPTKGEADVYQSIDEIVGKETTRNVAEGAILDARSVRRPLLVRRNEIVTVYARSEGISVRSTGRVRDDGAEGDVVTVETLEGRKPFFARASGPQEVEIFAQAVSATESTPRRTQ